MCGRRNSLAKNRGLSPRVQEAQPLDPVVRHIGVRRDDIVGVGSGFEFFEAFGIVLELEVGNDFIEIRDDSR
jgi:hypothetical protein